MVGNLQREGKSLGEQPTEGLGVGSSLGAQEGLHMQGEERILCSGYQNFGAEDGRGWEPKVGAGAQKDGFHVLGAGHAGYES